MRTLKLFTMLALLALPILAAAQAKIPETVAEHLAMAKQYQDKAAAYRKEAAFHREMAAEYKKAIAPAPKGMTENPWARKMEKHCMAIATTVEQLAGEAEKAAEYHTLRAKELEGK